MIVEQGLGGGVYSCRERLALLFCFTAFQKDAMVIYDK